MAQQGQGRGVSQRRRYRVYLIRQALMCGSVLKRSTGRTYAFALRRRRKLPQFEFIGGAEDVRRGGVRRISRTLPHPDDEPRRSR